ncbi:MAG: sulfite exporter TauE/SafE family protein [Candidatus Dojkabacteria bacterium]|nr:sulfite exporter TauE/SafE family protein [Candidatus Dojkabacteria bacterium]
MNRKKRKSDQKDSKENQEFTLYVEGMHCHACESFIKRKLKSQDDIETERLNYKTGELKIKISNTKRSIDEIIDKLNEEIATNGYKILTNKPDKSLNKKNIIYIISFFLALFIGLLIHFLNKFISGSLNFDVTQLGYLGFFVLGIIASISTCSSTVGGVLISLINKQISEKPKTQTIYTIINFNLARILGAIIIGIIFGYFGGIIRLDINIYNIVSIAVYIIMILLSLDVLNLFSFKLIDFSLTSKISKNISLPNINLSQIQIKTNNILKKFNLESFSLGLSTLFIPCAFSLTAQLEAIQKANFIESTLILLSFILGTVPIISFYGIATGYISKLPKDIFDILKYTFAFVIIFVSVQGIINFLLPYIT